MGGYNKRDKNLILEFMSNNTPDQRVTRSKGNVVHTQLGSTAFGTDSEKPNEIVLESNVQSQIEIDQSLNQGSPSDPNLYSVENSAKPRTLDNNQQTDSNSPESPRYFRNRRMLGFF